MITNRKQVTACKCDIDMIDMCKGRICQLVGTSVPFQFNVGVRDAKSGRGMDLLLLLLLAAALSPQKEGGRSFVVFSLLSISAARKIYFTLSRPFCVTELTPWGWTKSDCTP